MTAGQITDSAERLTALGYRRVSRAHGIVARIDRTDWLQVMADSMFTVVAAYIDQRTGKPQGQWADYYRRIHSKDRLQLTEGYDSSSRPVVMAKFMEIPGSGFNDCGYIDPQTLQAVEPPKLPADVLAFLKLVAEQAGLPYSSVYVPSEEAFELMKKYGGATL